MCVVGAWVWSRTARAGSCCCSQHCVHNHKQARVGICCRLKHCVRKHQQALTTHALVLLLCCSCQLFWLQEMLDYCSKHNIVCDAPP